jgi:hypothetical protein
MIVGDSPAWFDWLLIVLILGGVVGVVLVAVALVRGRR